RPITEEGPVPAQQVKGLKLLDVVEIEVGKNIPNGHQIENYEMIENPWKKIETLTKKNIAVFLDNPSNIWDVGEIKGKDRLTPQEITTGKINNSLCLIHINNFTVKYEKREFDGRTKSKYYGLFQFKGVDYKLSITDPEFTKQFYKIGNYSLNDVIICISLAGIWEERNESYKLIAGVIQ
ncbi:MAG TPA: hypothetical protein PLF61_05975, partial [Candidatus Goldiibacteriota bacterium]|nr:hypothetical protein [Candidatus Goldiibacteriota bacterium]